jgi:hypothetical protein
MLSIEGLAKRYGETIALENVAATFSKGAIHTILGENGSGKKRRSKTLWSLPLLWRLETPIAHRVAMDHGFTDFARWRWISGVDTPFDSGDIGGHESNLLLERGHTLPHPRSRSPRTRVSLTIRPMQASRRRFSISGIASYTGG